MTSATTRSGRPPRGPPRAGVALGTAGSGSGRRSRGTSRVRSTLPAPLFPTRPRNPAPRGSLGRRTAAAGTAPAARGKNSPIFRDGRRAAENASRARGRWPRRPASRPRPRRWSARSRERPPSSAARPFRPSAPAGQMVYREAPPLPRQRGGRSKEPSRRVHGTSADMGGSGRDRQSAGAVRGSPAVAQRASGANRGIAPRPIASATRGPRSRPRPSAPDAGPGPSARRPRAALRRARQATPETKRPSAASASAASPPARTPRGPSGRRRRSGACRGLGPRASRRKSTSGRGTSTDSGPGRTEEGHEARDRAALLAARIPNRPNPTRRSASPRRCSLAKGCRGPQTRQRAGENSVAR